MPNKAINKRTSLGGMPSKVQDKKKEKKNTKKLSPANPKNCPCGQHDPDSWVLSCTNCTQEWHSNCSNLKGITKPFVEQLIDWMCPFCFSPPGVEARNNTQTDSLILRISNLSDDNASLTKQITSLEDKLTSLIADTDRISSSYNQIAERVVALSEISTGLTHLNLQQDKTNSTLKALSVKLESISTTATPQPEHVAMPPPCPEHLVFEPPAVPSGMVPATIINDFINEQVTQPIVDFLTATEFNDENGHSVKSFGHPYSYVGSKATTSPPTIPEALQPLVESINKMQADEFYKIYPELKKKGAAPVINSCLVNRYVGQESFLPEHSDNEITIHPESSIFTITVGESCEILFAEKSSKTDSLKLDCSHRSMYRMTRRSQDFFSHRIEKGSVKKGVRYSLTFRSVSWKNRNSTCIVGDSNTGRLAFGTGKLNSFGELMPGQRFWAATMEDIKPEWCCGYNNIVVSCGINNLKKNDVRSQEDIDRLFLQYKLKINEIRQFNSSINIFIVPILPTKSNELNKKALYFNSRIFRDLDQPGLGVSHVRGLDDFLDRNMLLSERLSKKLDNHGRLDLLHLNEVGVKRFAAIIKKAIFNRLNRGAEKRRRTRTPSRTQNEPTSSQVASLSSPDGCQV